MAPIKTSPAPGFEKPHLVFIATKFVDIGMHPLKGRPSILLTEVQLSSPERYEKA
jgi:hypothetical protein